MALAVSLSCLPSMAFAETEGAVAIVKGNAAFVEMPSDWSTSALSNAAANGLLKGYKEGDGMHIKTSATLTRAEIEAIVNRAVGASQATTLKEVTDISSEAWYATEIAKAVYSALNVFQDKDDIASWAKESICALVEKGVLFGNNGNINPTANITRAEFAKIMDNMVQQYINTAGTVTTVAASGNVMVNVAGVTLRNVTVNGDLIIGDGVGSGEVTLDSV